MIFFPKLASVFLVTICLTYCVGATDRYFDDVIATSPSGRFRVEAKSPDNDRKLSPEPFQGSFVYSCKDRKSGALLWGRKQPMGKPQRLSADSKETLTFPKEGQPIQIFVSDSGWTVIRTVWDELIVIDIAGRQRGIIEIVKAGFTNDDRAKYIQDTTAGSFWSSYSLWYFRATHKFNLPRNFSSSSGLEAKSRRA